MNATQLLAHFDRLSEAPDAVPRLRRFILDLAVRGKLVEQDARDEPAECLLEQCELERIKAVEAGLVRKEKKLPPIFDDVPYPLPVGWVWTRLGSTGRIFNGDSVSEGEKAELSKVADGHPFIATKDVGYGWQQLNYENGLRVPVGASALKVLRANSVLICAEGGSAGKKTGLTDRDICFGNKLFANEPWNGINASYLLALYQSSFFYTEFSYRMTGIIGGISRSEFVLLPVPIPPAEEQIRIVAKVYELMTLCDQLESAQQERERRRDSLVAASLQRLNQPAAETTPEEQREYVRFHLNSLPRFTMRPDQIKGMRQLFLNLAVRGKLTVQSADDETAADLLRKIHLEKQKQPRTSRKTEINLPAVDWTSVPFELPAGWAWARFPEVGVFGRGKSKHRPRNDASLFVDGTHPLVQTGDVARSKGLITTFTSRYNDVGLAQSMKWPAGTLCITIAANIADSGILSFDACFPDSVVGFKASALFDSARYFEYFVRTAKANLLEFAPATAQKNINLEILNAVLIPLPPLAEQNRIVAKVDELMALCDQLEVQLATTQTDSRRLLEAVLSDALEPA